MFWGFSPALNLFEELPSLSTAIEVNILLIGCADPRHILKTLSQSYKHENVIINFFVVERFLEPVARQILLLNVALEPHTQLGLFEKSRIFMELYGNTIIRPPVSKYLTKKATQLVKAVTNDEYCTKMMPIINVQKLKFRERDYLECLFKFWSKKASDFDIVGAWDRRLRKHLGVRYDNRHGAFDWDYFMRLCDVGGDRIFSREYINWRTTGVAFTWLEIDGTLPNLTMAAGILTNGEQLLHHGYLGDIQIGPFLAFGIECDDESIWTKENGQYRKRATDVTELNLVQIFHETATKTPYTSSQTRIGADLGCVITQLSDAKIDLYANCIADKYNIDDMEPLITTKNVSVTYLPYTLLSIMHTKSCYKDFFDLYVISNLMTDTLTPEIITTAKNNAVFIFESKKFMVNLNKDNVKEYATQLTELSEKCGLTILHDFEPMQDCYAKYAKQVPS